MKKIRVLQSLGAYRDERYLQQHIVDRLMFETRYGDIKNVTIRTITFVNAIIGVTDHLNLNGVSKQNRSQETIKP